MTAREIIRIIEADGWVWVNTTGSHRHFKHPTKRGKVTVPYHKGDLAIRTARSILRQAGL